MRAATDEIRLVRRDNNGPAVGVSGITIVRESDSVAATIYTTRGGSTTIPQSSLTTDQDGYVVQPGGASAFVDLDDYLVQASGSRAIHWDVTGGAVNSVVGQVGDVWGVLPVFNVLNPAYAGGADPTGAADSAAAGQAAIDAAGAAGGGIVYWPAGNYKLTALAYNSGGISANLCPHDHGVRLRGAGKRATTLMALATGHNLPLDFMGRVQADGDPNNYAANKWTDQTCYSITGTYEKGDRVLTFATPGDESNFAVGDPVLVATGQVNNVVLAQRDKNPDSSIETVIAVDTTAHTITLSRGLPRHMEQEYYADGTSTAFSTLTPSAFPSKFGVYNLSGLIIRDVGVSDLTIVTANTIGEALSYREIDGLTVERVRLESAAGQGVHVGQNFTNGIFRDIELDTDNAPGDLGYWGFAGGTSHVLVERHSHIHHSDCASAIFNESVADIKLRDIVQFSAKGAPTNRNILAAGSRSVDMDIDGVLIVNSGPGASVNIIESGPSIYTAGNGRIANVKQIGQIASPGGVRGNWQVENCDPPLDQRGPADDPGATGAIPLYNASRKGVQTGAYTARFPYNQTGNKLYIGRLPAGAFIRMILDVTTAFTANTKIRIGTTNVTTLVDTAGNIALDVRVDAVGEIWLSSSNDGVMSQTVDQDVFITISAGSPTVGELVAYMTWAMAPLGI